MKEYVNADYLLQNETAKKLYHEYSEAMPVIDYHCHVLPEEIYEDRPFENITQAWLLHDHYKWRIMRAVGIDEKYITGDGSDFEKFKAYSRALEKAVGNPLYSWSHMELKKYFGCTEILKESNAEAIWEATSEYLKNHRLSPISAINSSNVEVICTTDDPTDSLEWHLKLKELTESHVLKAKVLPAWRPDKIINIDKKGYLDYLNKLSNVSGVDIHNVEDLRKALTVRMDFFGEMGCKVSDHGLDYIPYVICSEKDLEEIFEKVLAGNRVSSHEAEKYKTAIMLFLFKEYSRRNWIAQLHYSCERNNNFKSFEKFGADSGYDCISNYAPSHKLVAFMNRVNTDSDLPKTIIYSLNPADNAVIDSIIGSFQDGGVPGKIQHGAPWWFNDHRDGMEEMLTSLANRGVIGEFIGMLTDSRSFLSYERHDYFRRVLANLIGRWVEEGLYPEDYESLGNIIKGISYENAKEYFGF
jgi:glucuronate isomerase